MSDRMRFILDGDDRLSRVLNRAGDSSERLHRRLADMSRRSSTAVRSMADDTGTRLRSLQGRFSSTADSADSMGSRMLAAGRRLLGISDASTRAQRGVAAFTTDASGRLHDLRGRFISTADAQRLLGDGAPDVAARLRDVGGAGGSAATSLGSSGGGLSGGMMAVAGAAGLSLLPALGALVPMLAGGALAAGTLKLGFAGVSDAMEASTKGKKEYAEALKKLSPETRSFVKELVGMKKEFSGVGKDVQKAMLPGFTRALKDAAPVVKILGKSMTEMGGAFGDAARGVGRLLKDSGFQSDLQANLKLGAGFVRDMTSSMGPFVRSLLDFGAASGPTLKAFSDGIGGLLSKGLPSMFDGLKVGIPGTAKMLDGLFSAVTDIVGGIGRLGGEAGRVLGPLFGQTFAIGGDIATGAMDALAGALDKLQPLFRDVTFGLKTIRDVGALIGPTLKDTALGIAGAFLPIGDSVSGAVGPLQRLNMWVSQNKGTVLEWARVFGTTMIDITGAAINSAPVIIGGFKQIATGVLTAFDGIISGAAHAFGWIPGIGDKLKAANRHFDDFKGAFLTGLDKAQSKASEFAASAAPKLAAGKLKLDINNWQSQIEAAKAKLKTVPPSKQAALKASIADLEAKIRSAKGQLNSLNGRTATTYVQTVFTTKGSKSAVAPAHRAYASGGTPKAGEVAMVGEQGPELVVFGEDARVFDAKKTQSMLRGSGFGVRSATSSGVAVAQGLVAGMSGATGEVGAAARLMAAAVTVGIRDEMEIRSPSKKTKALAKDMGRGLIVGLTGSQAKIKSTAADLVKDIKTAFSGRKESSLVRYVDKQTDRLLATAKKRDAIASKIAEAKKYAGDLTSSARQGAGLSSLGLEEGDQRGHHQGRARREAGAGQAVHELHHHPGEEGPEQGAAAAGPEHGPGGRVRLRLRSGRRGQGHLQVDQLDPVAAGRVDGDPGPGRRRQAVRLGEERVEGLPRRAALPGEVPGEDHGASRPHHEEEPQAGSRRGQPSEEDEAPRHQRGAGRSGRRAGGSAACGPGHAGGGRPDDRPGDSRPGGGSRGRGHGRWQHDGEPQRAGRAGNRSGRTGPGDAADAAGAEAGLRRQREPARDWG